MHENRRMPLFHDNGRKGGFYMDNLLTEFKSIPLLIRQSGQGIKNVKTLVGTSLFVAMNAALGYFKIIVIPKML